MFSKITLFILSIIVFTSCVNYDIPQNYFLQHEANTLKLQNKNDLKVAGGLFISNFSYDFYSPNGLDYIFYNVSKRTRNLQVAYSPLKYLGVFGTHSSLRNVDSKNSSTLFHRSQNTGGGVGSYYSIKFPQRPLNKLKNGQQAKYDNLLLDVYGGYTLGKIENNEFIVFGNNEFQFEKRYTQFGIHWESPTIGLSFVFKKWRINYYKGRVIGKTLVHDDVIQDIIMDTKFPFQESTFKFDFRKKGIGYYTQLTFSSISDLSYSANMYQLAHVGIIVDIQEVRKSIFKKKK